MGLGRLPGAILVAVAVLHVGAGAGADSRARDSSAAVAGAANRLLQALAPEQARAAVLPRDSGLVANWSNLPAGRTRFERNGVRIGDLGDSARAALSEFLAAALSPAGVELVRGIIAAESALAASPRASGLGWHPDNYWLAFFGEPAAGGVALLGALSGEQRDTAVVARRQRELYAGAGRDGVVPPVEGSRVTRWPAERQRQLLDLISLWVGVMPPPAAERRLAQIETELPDLRFVWHGPADGSGSFYYRIQGPTLLIEFSTRGSLGAAGGHYHSVYRDRTNEYGRGRSASR